MNSDNICAIATPYGVGAISIIRCSGQTSIELVNKIFKGCDLTKVKSHTINYGYILDDKNEVIDEVLANVFIGPNSFDGENSVEINCHGGVFVTNQVLERLLAVGFRMAEGGEFSKRAFLNHKIDLTQAEAIMDIISSSNKIALKSSTNSLRKQTSKLVDEFRDKLLDVIAKIEVNIDYPEYDDAITVTHEYLLPIILPLVKEMESIINNSKISTIAIHGIKTAIVGKPNVGKSSLLNMLLEEDKAIVSSEAGTTRDLVEGSLTIGNATLHLIDTAGIHESDNYVESIGIKRSEKAINDADLVLLVLDSSRELEDIDYKLLDLTKDKRRIIIANKQDKQSAWNLDEALLLSTKDNSGIDLLVKKIYEITKIEEFDIDSSKYLNNERQVSLMQKALVSLKNSVEAINNDIDIDLIEIDIKESFAYLGEITGNDSQEELINALFTKFCLGK